MHKKRNESEKLLLPAVTLGILTYQNVYIDQTHNLRKFGEDTILQT